jgi:DNA-binding PadR family transcriptional regulator
MMFDLTGFQRDLLYVTAGLEQPSGQTIKEALSEDRGEVNPGRLYPNLDTLVERSLVEKGEQNGRSNYYQITEKGLETIRSRREWEDRQLPGGV